MPRRDHSSIFLKNNKYLAVFGGRTNEKVLKNGQFGYQGLNEILLFDLAEKEWQCLAQLGFAPSGRWSSAFAVSEINEQIYIFGGSNNSEGFCSNQLYCLDFNKSNINQKLADTRQVLDEVFLLMKNYIKNFKQ